MGVISISLGDSIQSPLAIQPPPPQDNPEPAPAPEPEDNPPVTEGSGNSVDSYA